MLDKKPAGVVALIVWSGKLLLILRDDKPEISHPNTWAPPGGGVEEGESLPEAIEREVREELGIKPELHMLGVSRKANGFFWASLSDKEKNSIRLGEGQRYDFFEPNQLDSLKTGGAIRIYWERYRHVLKEAIIKQTRPSGRFLDLSGN